jgi:hypothetical protein
MADGFSFEEDDKKGGSATPQSGFTWESDKTAPAAESPSTSQPTEPSTWEKLTRGYNPDVEQFAEKHPVLGPPARFLDAAGGAMMSLPGGVASSVMHPIDTAKGAIQSVEDWGKPQTWKGALGVLPEALGQGVGNVAGGEMAGAAASRIPKIPESVAEAARVRTPRNPTGALKPAVRTTAQTLGAVGGAMSHGPYGALAGYALAPKLLDMVIPNLEKAEPPLVYGPTRMNPEHIASVNPEAMPSIGRTGAGQEPFEPLVYSSPEEAAQNDFRMANLKRQASAAGTYHAAQGAAGKRLNLQQRIGRKFIPKVSE